MLDKKVDLLNGSIVKGLTKLAVPIMATAFLQMGYNLIDMIWIGKVGSNAVAAVGVASMYIWLSNGLIMIPRVGTQVKVAQSLGANQQEEAITYAKSGFQLAGILGILFGMMCVILNPQLIGFFGMDNPLIVNDARGYLIVTGGCILVNYVNQIYTGTWTALGNSQVTLWATMVGLVINLVLDPVLIFGIGPFPRLGVFGAGLATVFAQCIVCIVFCAIVKKNDTLFGKITQFGEVSVRHWKIVFQIGCPAGVQSMLFTFISMIIARMITSFGDAAIAVQKVGTQIESISWMTVEGFATAINALIAQNYGAGNEERVDRGYKVAMMMVGVWGIFTSSVLMLFPAQLFSIFISESDILPLGVDYLRIIGISQLFMCLELAAAGAFQGVGKSYPPAITGIVFVGMRIPLAYVLCRTSLGLNGIWWAITISCVVKGILLPIWFMYERKKSRLK